MYFNNKLSGIGTQCVAFVWRENFLIFGENKCNLILHLEYIYNIYIIKFLIMNKKSCSQYKLTKNFKNYLKISNICMLRDVDEIKIECLYKKITT